MAAFVQNLASTISKSPAATTVITIVTGKTPAKGNLIVLRCAEAQSSGTGTVAASATDTQGNHYVLGVAGENANITAGATLLFAHLDTALAVGNTITVTWVATPTAAVAIIADEFSGVDAILDGADTTQNWVNGGTGSVSLAVTPAITPLVDTVLVLMMAATNGPIGDTYTEDGSAAAGGDTWHSLTRVGTTGAGAGSNCTVAGAYKLATSGTSVNFSWTPTTTSRNWTAIADLLQFSRPVKVPYMPPLIAQ